jgi:pRiA4b ORF-3-like protein
MPRRARTAPPRLYQLKVTLKDVKPPVWRRLLVPADIPLHKLHAVIQEAMGWESSHLHQFSLNGRRIGDISLLENMDVFGEDTIEDESQVRLDALVRPKQSLLYEYDFGDDWRHTVRVEKELAPDAGSAYPRCTGGARACPPEDCGGPWGYANFLAALKDPRHPEHAQFVSWIGGAFDPEDFNLTRVNKALAELR